MSGHEKANLQLQADGLGPEIFNAMYRTQDGSPAYERFAGQSNIPQHLLQDQQAAGREMRFVNEQMGQYSGSQQGTGQQSSGQQGGFQQSAFGQAGGQQQQPSAGQSGLPISQGNGQGSYQEQLFQQSFQGGQQGQQGGQAQGGFSMSQGQDGQAQGGFSGYGSPDQSYGVNPSREWKMQSGGQATSQYYDRLPKVFNRAIVGVRKDGRGNIEAFRLEDGTTLNYAQMMNAVNQDAVSGLRIQANREGELIIRSVPDGFTDNNLDNLPQF